MLIESGKILAKSHFPHNTVLDLGCGPGLYWKEACSNFKFNMITGVDLRSNHDMLFEEQNESFIQTIEECKAISENSFLSYEYIQSDIISFVHSSIENYDLIVCFQILSLLSKSDAKELLNSFKNILKTNGIIALCIPNKDFIIIDKLPLGIPESLRNKFNLDNEEFMQFIDGYKIILHRQSSQYHWALIGLN